MKTTDKVSILMLVDQFKGHPTASTNTIHKKQHSIIVPVIVPYIGTIVLPIVAVWHVVALQCLRFLLSYKLPSRGARGLEIGARFILSLARRNQTVCNKVI